MQSVTRFGWAARAGLEAAFTDNLTARVEYLFVGPTSEPGSPRAFEGYVNEANLPVIDVVGAVLDGRDRKFCALRICGHGCAGAGGRSGRSEPILLPAPAARDL